MNSIWQENYAVIALHLVIALGAGAIIGLERSYHGRPAGFRTHALVCLSSCMLMVLTVYQDTWFAAFSLERVSVDPTRMAQGIMTGIGFLGAGVIMRHGPTVRGLTTAASIWITAGIGILVGIGFYVGAVLTAALAILALTGLRWIERHVRSEAYADFSVCFAASQAPAQSDVIALAAHHGFSVSGMSQHFHRGEAILEYGMTVYNIDRSAFARLSDALRARADVLEFRIS